MTSSSPFPYSDRDIDRLRQALIRGDAEGKVSAIREAATLGRRAEPLIPTITEQLRAGLPIASSEVVDLLYATRNADLYKAALEAGALRHLGFHDKCRLLVIGQGDYEDEICTYAYRNWQNPADPMVREAITALEVAGTALGRGTLAALLPELSEMVNVGSFGSGPANLLEDVESRVIKERLDLVRKAVGAIDSRIH